MKIVFATNNAHKLSEIREIVGTGVEILSLADIGCHEDIPETGRTLEQNAIQKAMYVYDKYKTDCFADDTGLEVEALNGEPGVHSARYAEGTDHDSEANMAKLLAKLKGKDNRRARFRTVIVLATSQGVDPSLLGDPAPGSDMGRAAALKLFDGIVEGSITTEKHGTGGFGYDPIFRPDGYDKTFGELPHEVKNSISHRARAVAKLANYLKGEKVKR